MISKPYRPHGRGKCPICGAKLSVTMPGEASSTILPGVDCTKCDYGEIYYPPVCDDDGRGF